MLSLPISPLQRAIPLGIALVLAASAAEARIVPRHAAQSAGLTRAWFTQLALDPTTQHLAGAVFRDGVLYTLSSAGSLQAIDAETGVTRWTTRLGSPSLPAYGPSVHREVVTDSAGVQTVINRCAIVIGSTLFVLDADNGAEVFSRRIAGAPATGPALGDDHAYVSLLSGQLIGYPFDQVKGVPFRVASPGQLDSQPLVARDQVIWSTKQGHLYGASAKNGRPSYRFDAAAPIAGAPSVVEDRMYFANKKGVVFAMEAEKARPVWRSTVGTQVTKPVVAVGDTVYIQADGPVLYALDRSSGQRRWSVEGVSDFVSASADRLYAVTPDGALAVLDRESGRPVGSWPAGGKLHPVANTENDRLYFASDSGLIQCFHEAGLAEPVRHDGAVAAAPVAEEPADDAEAPAEQPAEEPADDAPFDPFAPVEEPADQPADAEPEVSSDDPFSTDGADPDDPFADF